MSFFRSLFRSFPGGLASIHPSSCVPHLAVPTLRYVPNDPAVLSRQLLAALPANQRPPKPVQIRTIVLSKDDVFAHPGFPVRIPPAVYNNLSKLRERYKLLVVTDSIMLGREDGAADQLESETLIDTFRPEDTNRKPICATEVLEWVLKHHPDTKHPGEICVVGTIRTADVLMGSFMGAWTVLITDGLGEMGGKGYKPKVRLSQALERVF